MVQSKSKVKAALILRILEVPLGLADSRSVLLFVNREGVGISRANHNHKIAAMIENNLNLVPEFWLDPKMIVFLF